jgi:hypothetical protein
VQGQILIALIAAAAGLVGAGLGAGLTMWSNIRLERVREDYRRLAVEANLGRQAARQRDEAREPLLIAARELHRRIENIRKTFLLYARNDSDPRRQKVANLGTAFRMARYWAVVEDLYGTTDLRAIEGDTHTRKVAGTINDIERAFASDSRYGGTAMMIWRDEQRAVGELMGIAARESGSAGRYLNFATFVDEYDTRFAPWLDRFLGDLTAPGSEQHPRLAEIERLLRVLVHELGHDREPVARTAPAAPPAPGTPAAPATRAS